MPQSCSRCGETVGAESEYCSQCGAKLGGETPGSVASGYFEYRMKSLGFGSVLLLVDLLVVGVMYYLGQTVFAGWLTRFPLEQQPAMLGALMFVPVVIVDLFLYGYFKNR